MLLNAYRAIFKSAYFKGMASAVVLTSALAAGSTNAADFYTYDTSGASSFWSQQQNIDEDKLSATLVAGTVAGDILSGSNAELTAQINSTNVATGGKLEFGTQYDISTMSGNAWGGNVQGTGNVEAYNNEVTLADGALISKSNTDSRKGNVVGGRAISSEGSASAHDNTVTITRQEDLNAPNSGDIIGGYAEGLTGATASSNHVNISAEGETNKLSLSSSGGVIGGSAIFKKDSTQGVFVSENNTVTITNVKADWSADSSNPHSIIGGQATGQTSGGFVNNLLARGNQVDLTDIEVSGGTSGGLIVGNLAVIDLSAGDADTTTSSALGSDEFAVKITNGNIKDTAIYGGNATSRNGSAYANSNIVELTATTVSGSKSIVGGHAQSSGSAAIVNANSNSVTINGDESAQVYSISGASVYGGEVELDEQTDLSKISAQASGNVLKIGSNVKVEGSGYIIGAQVNADKSGATVVMNDNIVQFDGQTSSDIIGANYDYDAEMQNNAVTINGKVTANSGKTNIIVAARNVKGADTDDVSTFNNNKVTIGENAEISNVSIVAAYTAALSADQIKHSGNTVEVNGKYSLSESADKQIIGDNVIINSEVNVANGTNLTIAGLQTSDSKFLNGVGTITSDAVISNGGTIKVFNDLTVEDGAVLSASQNTAKLLVDAQFAQGNEENPVTENKATLRISDDLLKSYLTSTDESAAGLAASDAQGIVQVTSGGTIDFKDEVVLSDFNFANTDTAGAIVVDSDITSGKSSIFKAEKVTVEHALASNGAEDKDYKDYTGINDDGVIIEANTLTLGASDLASAYSEKIDFAQATVKNVLNFVALNDGKEVDDNGNKFKNDGYHLTTNVIGSNYQTVNSNNAELIYWEALPGQINGDVVLTTSGAAGGSDSGSLTIKYGNWTADDKITLEENGVLTIGGAMDQVTVGSTSKNIEADATLTASNVVLNVDETGDASSILVDGQSDTAYDPEVAAQSLGDDRLVKLDLSEQGSLTMHVSGSSTIKGKATVKATSGGVIVMNASDVNTILSQNNADGVNVASGAFFEAEQGGVLYVKGDLKTTFEDFSQSDNGIKLVKNNDPTATPWQNGILVADTLSVDNVPASNTEVDEKDYTSNFKSVSFGGTVVVDELSVNDQQLTKGDTKPETANQYASKVTIANGDIFVAKTLSSKNETVELGTASGPANLTLVTDLVGDEGAVDVSKLKVVSGAVSVDNGQWTANSIELVGKGASLEVGDEYGVEDANGEDYAASLTATSLAMGADSTFVVGYQGEAKFDTADFSKLTQAYDASQPQSAAVTVKGHLTIVGDKDQTSAGVKFGKEGTIAIAKNGVLEFGNDAVNNAIVKDANYSGAATVSTISGYTKIANNGGTLKLNFADNTVFDSEDVTDLKEALFTNGSLDSDSVLINGGILNIGAADFAGVSVDPLEGEGLSGYTISWDNAREFSDVYGDDVTNDTFVHTNVNSIDEGDSVQGHWGSLSMVGTAIDSAQVTISGFTSLNYAEGNNGYFISNAAHSAAMGADIQEGKSLTLIGGGEIGAVTLQDSNLDGQNSTTFTVLGDGLTTIKSIKGNGETDNTYVLLDGAEVVVGDVENIDTFDVANGTALQADNVKVNDFSTYWSDSVIAKNLTIGEATVMGGSLVVKGDVVYDTGSDQDLTVDIVDGGMFTADSFSFKNGGTLNVGLDLDEQSKLYTAEDGTQVELTGTGYFETNYLDLNNGTLVVDPAYGEKTSVAGVSKFGTKTDTFDYNDSGVIEGSVQVGSNAALGIGANVAETKVAIAYYQTNGSLSADKYGSILYLNGQVKLAADSEIALNSDVDAASIRDSLKYTVKDQVLDQYADLGLGANTAILMTENAFEDENGNKTGTAIYFDKEAAVVNGEGGEIVLVGAFDTSEPLNIFNDKKDDGVKIIGSVDVYTQNGFLYAELSGDQAGKNVQMQVDMDHAAQRMYEASDPVLATLVAYGNRNVVADTPVVDEPVQEPSEEPSTEPETPAEPETQPGTGTNGPIVDVNTSADSEEVTSDAEPAVASLAARAEEPVVNQAPAAKVSSKFLDEVITTSHGAPAETAARMAVYGGAVQAAMAANATSYEAIATRMGMGNPSSVLTYANNADGAGIWLAPVYKNHDSDGFDAQGVDYGVDMDLYGVALGADFTFAQGFRVGAMFNVGSGDADGKGAGSAVSNDFDYWGVSIYGGYSYENFSITADIGYTEVDNDIDASTGMANASKLTASTDTEAWTVGVNAQYKFELSALDITPHVGVRFTRIDMDDYSVNSNIGKVADFDADSMNVFSIPVGVTFSKDITAGDWSVMPSLDLVVTANTGDDELDGDTAWTGTNLSTATSTEVLDDFTYGANLGLSATNGAFSFGLGVNYVGSDNADEFGVQANARFTF